MPQSKLPLSRPFWWDAHCHLVELLGFPEKLDSVLKSSIQSGVQGWVIGGISPQDMLEQGKIRTKYGPNVVTSVGLHPWWVSHQTQEDVIRSLSQFDHLVHQAHAVGEIGLDYSSDFRRPESKAKQLLACEHALKVSHIVSKPLILHVVQAHSDLLALLDRFGSFPKGGMVHGFTGSPEIAQQYIRRGFLISIGTGILKTGYKQLKKTAFQLRDDQFLLETDSLDPAQLLGVAEALADLRKDSRDSVLFSSSRNLCRLFGLDL